MRPALARGPRRCCARRVRPPARSHSRTTTNGVGHGEGRERPPGDPRRPLSCSATRMGRDFGRWGRLWATRNRNSGDTPLGYTWTTMVARAHDHHHQHDHHHHRADRGRRAHRGRVQRDAATASPAARSARSPGMAIGTALGLLEPGDDRALDRARVRLRLRADQPAAAARRAGARARSSRSRSPPTRSRSRRWRSSTTRSCSSIPGAMDAGLGDLLSGAASRSRSRSPASSRSRSTAG